MVPVAVRLTFREMVLLDSRASSLGTTRSQLAAALFRIAFEQYPGLKAEEVVARIRP